MKKDIAKRKRFRIMTAHQATNLMKITSAITKLEKNGFTIKQDSQLYTATKTGLRYVVEFMKNGRSDETACVGVRAINDRSDSMSDYCATIFCKSLKQAIELAH